jgi:hypothetical protein
MISFLSFTLRAEAALRFRRSRIRWKFASLENSEIVHHSGAIGAHSK